MHANHTTYLVEYPGLCHKYGFWYKTREFTSLLAAYRFWKARDKGDLVRFKKFEGKAVIASK